jgi:acetyl esterase/lipase
MIDRILRYGAALIFLVSAMPFSLGAMERNVTKDIVFATVGDIPLALDLYQPKGKANNGLIVWIHGGAWRSGSKEKVPILGLVDKGWALASVNYRLSGQARFPAQSHDIKGAIRFLRANQKEYGLRANRVFVIGSSAGGHLAAQVGVTNGHAGLEGAVGGNGKVSSDIQGIVSLYGASNLTTILNQSTPHGLSVRVPALDAFIGGQPEDLVKETQLASPVFHVDKKDPPLLMIHGDQDPQMPINQSIELLGKYNGLDLDVTFIPLHGAKHGGEAFYDAKRIEIMNQFLKSIR